MFVSGTSSFKLSWKNSHKMVVCVIVAVVLQYNLILTNAVFVNCVPNHET